MRDERYPEDSRVGPIVESWIYSWELAFCCLSRSAGVKHFKVKGV